MTLCYWNPHRQIRWCIPDIAPPKASAKSAKVMNKNEINDSEIALRKEKNRARRAYRAANPEKIKEGEAKYRAANREKVKAYQAEYYAVNPEKVKAIVAKYHAANSEKIKTYQAAYRAANREEIKASQAVYRAAKKAEAAAAITTTGDNHD